MFLNILLVYCLIFILFFVVVNSQFLINDSQNVSNQKDDFKRQICSQTWWLCIVETFYMFQKNPKEFVHNAAYSVQLPYIAGHSL